jgi:hypothetical protein
VKKTHDYVHHYRGYWSDGGRYRIRIYHEDGRAPVVICSQLPDNDNTSVTNMAEYLAAEVMESHPDIFDPFSLGNIPGISYDKPFVWIEHYLDGARGTPSDPATFDLVQFAHYAPREGRQVAQGDRGALLAAPRPRHRGGPYRRGGLRASERF